MGALTLYNKSILSKLACDCKPAKRGKRVITSIGIRLDPVKLMSTNIFRCFALGKTLLINE